MWTQPSGPLCLWQCFTFLLGEAGRSYSLDALASLDLKLSLVQKLMFFGFPVNQVKQVIQVIQVIQDNQDIQDNLDDQDNQDNQDNHDNHNNNDNHDSRDDHDNHYNHDDQDNQARLAHLPVDFWAIYFFFKII